jgi:hypothetical protein
MENYSISKSHHNKKNIPIWLVKPTGKLDYSTYKKVESAIKILGGYYSRFTNSFVFEKEPKESQLDEAFGGVKDFDKIAKESGVSTNKLAKIALNTKGISTVDKRTLRSEYEAGKLLVSRYQYFDGMYDTTRQIPDNERVWSKKDPRFEQEFDYSSRPYISGSVIKYGDFEAKYADDIIPLVLEKSPSQTSMTFFVDVEKETKVNDSDTYKLGRIDSKRNDLTEGTRVVLSLYGNKYCGKIIDKQISKYNTTSWTFGSNQKKVEEHEDVRYKVLLDNGITQTYSNFKVDTDNECDELSVDAINDKGTPTLAESFWGEKIIRAIRNINYTKKQKASRKKREYAEQDQKYIDRKTSELMADFSLWLSWEMKFKDYARKITGETESEQEFRINNWINELGIFVSPTEKKKKSIREKLIELNLILS